MKNKIQLKPTDYDGVYRIFIPTPDSTEFLVVTCNGLHSEMDAVRNALNAVMPGCVEMLGYNVAAEVNASDGGNKHTGINRETPAEIRPMLL